MALPGVAGAVFVLEALVGVVALGDVPLLLPDEVELLAQAVHQPLHGVEEEGAEIAAGLAGEVELAVVLGAGLVVVIAEQMRGG